MERLRKFFRRFRRNRVAPSRESQLIRNPEQEDMLEWQKEMKAASKMRRKMKGKKAVKSSSGSASAENSQIRDIVKAIESGSEVRTEVIWRGKDTPPGSVESAPLDQLDTNLESNRNQTTKALDQLDANLKISNDQATTTISEPEIQKKSSGHMKIGPRNQNTDSEVSDGSSNLDSKAISQEDGESNESERQPGRPILDTDEEDKNSSEKIEGPPKLPLLDAYAENKIPSQENEADPERPIMAINELSHLGVSIKGSNKETADYETTDKVQNSQGTPKKPSHNQKSESVLNEESNKSNGQPLVSKKSNDFCSVVTLGNLFSEEQLPVKPRTGEIKTKEDENLSEVGSWGLTVSSVDVWVKNTLVWSKIVSSDTDFKSTGNQNESYDMSTIGITHLVPPKKKFSVIMKGFEATVFREIDQNDFVHDLPNCWSENDEVSLPEKNINNKVGEKEKVSDEVKSKDTKSRRADEIATGSGKTSVLGYVMKGLRWVGRKIRRKKDNSSAEAVANDDVISSESDRGLPQN